jgi:hypothetical protein
MKAIYETVTGEFQEDEVDSVEEGIELCDGSEIWRVEDDEGNVLACNE